MTDEPTKDPVAHMAELLAGLQDLITPIQEATIGYRQKLVDKGMGKEAADQCATAYHNWLMSIVASSSTPKGGAFGVAKGTRP